MLAKMLATLNQMFPPTRRHFSGTPPEPEAGTTAQRGRRGPREMALVRTEN